MATENNGSKPFSFKSFLEQYHVVIPMVQRDYAQGRTTDDVTRVRNRFLDAIKSHLVKSEDDNDVMKMDFIYGETEQVKSTTTANKQEEIIVTPTRWSTTLNYFIFTALVCCKERCCRSK